MVSNPIMVSRSWVGSAAQRVGKVSAVTWAQRRATSQPCYVYVVCSDTGFVEI